MEVFIKEENSSKSAPMEVDFSMCQKVTLNNDNTISGSETNTTNGKRADAGPEEPSLKIPDAQKRIVNVNFKLENLLPESELLGSVTVGPSESGPHQAVRTSARVIQKMRMDSSLTRPATPPPKECDKKNGTIENASLPKTPTTSKFGGNKVLWSNTERTFFFEALNDYGKDFETITHHINQKMKRKAGLDTKMIKTRDQIRQLYVQTFHKVSKYLKFSEGKQMNEVRHSESDYWFFFHCFVQM